MSRKKHVRKSNSTQRNTKNNGQSPLSKKSRTPFLPGQQLLLKASPLIDRQENTLRTDTRSASPRVLMVIDQFNVGGTETYTLSLTKQLLRQGTAVIVAGKKGRMLDSFIGLGCPCYEIDFVLDHFEMDQLRYRKHLELLKSIIVSERIDLVHGHQVPSGQVAQQAAGEMNVPFVFTVHGTYYEAPFLQKLQNSTALISVSPAVQKLLIEKGLPSHLIPNGIHLQEQGSPSAFYREYIREKLQIPKDAKVVMYAGRLTWEKAEICSDILRAVSAMRKDSNRSLYLIIAGGGLKRSEIERQIFEIQQSTETSHIVSCGEVLNIQTYYHASDLTIGTGRIALEAMSSGCPFIAIGSKGELGFIRPELYSEAWNCWFGDHDAKQKWSVSRISEQIQQALSLSEKERMHIIQSNKQWVANHFHIGKVAAKINELYLRLVEQSRHERSNVFSMK